MKKRLDVLLVERGLAESRAQAQALVLAGPRSRIRQARDAGRRRAELEVEQPPPYVSRGGEKLAHALDAFGVDPSGRDCLDVGASTGGFTDVLLQRGADARDRARRRLRTAARPLAARLACHRARTDERARAAASFPFAPELVVADVSFISLKLALPTGVRARTPGWEAVVLVKPQFEAGKGEVGKGGVVRDLEVQSARRARDRRSGARLGRRDRRGRRLWATRPEGQPGSVPPPRSP